MDLAQQLLIDAYAHEGECFVNHVVELVTYLASAGLRDRAFSYLPDVRSITYVASVWQKDCAFGIAGNTLTEKRNQ